MNDVATRASSDSEARRSAQEVLLLSMSAMLKGVNWEEGFGEASLRLSSSIISDIFLLSDKTVLFKNLFLFYSKSSLEINDFLSCSIPSIKFLTLFTFIDQSLVRHIVRHFTLARSDSAHIRSFLQIFSLFLISLKKGNRHRKISLSSGVRTVVVTSRLVQLVPVQGVGGSNDGRGATAFY